MVRADEAFSLFATITNVGQSAANLLTVNLDDAALSGLELAPGETGSRTIDTLAPGDAAGFEFHFTSRRTGQVVASYLRFDAQGGAAVQGDLRFTVGVGERGVALSPDTLVAAGRGRRPAARRRAGRDARAGAGVEHRQRPDRHAARERDPHDA